MRNRRAAATLAAVVVMGSLATGQQAQRTVPVGTQIDLMLAKELTSKDAKADDPFEADSIVDVKRDGQVVIPSGAIARGFIGSVRAATRADRQGQLTLSFSKLQIGDQSVKLRASILAIMNPKRRPTDTRASAPIDLADPGAMAPMTGVVISPGGSLQSMMSGDLVLPVGVVLRVALDRPIEIR